jgi:hypothetical protein
MRAHRQIRALAGDGDADLHYGESLDAAVATSTSCRRANRYLPADANVPDE